jgi:C-8 sterol isomerase
MSYIFDPDALHGMVRSALDLPNAEAFDAICAAVEERHPGVINHERTWLFSNAGGCMYGYTILYASLTEYLIIFGSPIMTGGHTGRHLADIHDFVISGELWYYAEHRPYERIVRKAGDRYHLPRLKSEGLAIPNSTWVLEYARGIIPLMLPFGMAGSVFSALDFVSIYRQLSMYARVALAGRGRGLPTMPTVQE